MWWKSCWKNSHAVKNINHLFHLASEIIEVDRLHLFLLSNGTRIDDNEYPRKPRKRYRINCLHRGTNPKIADLFWIKKILKPHKHLLSIKHWLFFMSKQIGRLLSKKMTFMCSFIEEILGISSLVESVFIAFWYEFEQAKHIQ